MTKIFDIKSAASLFLLVMVLNSANGSFSALHSFSVFKTSATNRYIVIKYSKKQNCCKIRGVNFQNLRIRNEKTKKPATTSGINLISNIFIKNSSFFPRGLDPKDHIHYYSNNIRIWIRSLQV